MEVVGKLKPLQYLKWKNSLLEMQKANLDLKVIQQQFQIQEKDIEIQQLKLLQFRNSIASKQQSKEDALSNYNNITKNLEKDLGFSIRDLIIDENSLELKKE